MKKLLALSLLAAAVSGCATSPEHIQPALVSQDQYMSIDCPQLDTSMTTAKADLKKFSDMHAEGLRGDSARR